MTRTEKLATYNSLCDTYREKVKRLDAYTPRDYIDVIVRGVSDIATVVPWTDIKDRQDEYKFIGETLDRQHYLFADRDFPNTLWYAVPKVSLLNWYHITAEFRLALRDIFGRQKDDIEYDEITFYLFNNGPRTFA